MASGYRQNDSPETHAAELTASGIEYVQYELANEYAGPTSPAEQGLRKQVSPGAFTDHSQDDESGFNG